MRTNFLLLTVMLVWSPAWLGAAPPDEHTALFDGKTFAGWEGDTKSTWRIEDGALVGGSLDRKQAKNDFLATVKEYANFELTLKYELEGKEGFINGGVQFRSKRVPNSPEVSGYQADLGMGYDGALYDESRRNKVLARPGKEVFDKAVKPLGEWNDYRIRAEGRRIQIWLNGVQTVDYTEPDEKLPQTGIIALQLHGGAVALVRYKELQIRELPQTPATRSTTAPAMKPAGANVFKLMPNQTMAFIGGANLERTRFDAILQTQLLAAPEARPLKLRNLAWEGDTVYEQWRDVNFPSIARQLDQVGATVVLAQFGQMESMAGPEKLPEFVSAYERLLDQIKRDNRRIVLVSPTPFEKPPLPLYPDLSQRNGDAKKYCDAIRALAARTGLHFIDLFTPLVSQPPGLTDDGLHLDARGQTVVSAEITRQLGLKPPPIEANEPLHQAAREWERLWFSYWRPMNWAFLSGDRTNVEFSKDWRDKNTRIFPKEMKEFVPILDEAEANIARALADEAQRPIEARGITPSEPPSVRPQTPEEELATLEIHPDYQVNLFASEKDGIGKVVQIRWDERGRLWALCIPDYPQPKPGAKPGTRLMICEDTDHNGRADKFTVFADGLDMSLGFELADGGVYLASSSELWFLRDTTGGDHANERRLVLGGFGTGDTHQTINSLSWGFGGELWFTQGHSIYSRVETPYGIEHHNRAGVWRFRPRTGHLDTFNENSSAGLNNWGVLTDDFGQVFHKDGAANGAWYSVPGLVRSDLPLDSEAMHIFQSRTKTVGFDFVQTKHFPDELQGSVVIGGVYDNSLQLHSLSFVNGQYRTKLEHDIIRTKNRTFRPCDVRFGPDGALYFADWYNVIVGHYQASYRHPDRDLVHGRIWRVTRKDRPTVKPVSLASADTASLLEQLDSSERWTKYQARRLLIGRDSAGVLPALDQWVSTLKPGDPKDEYRRLMALALYEAQEAPRPELLRSLLRSPDARIRAYATRTLSTWTRDGHLSDALRLLEQQIADEDGTVRLEAIVAASYISDPRAAVVAARALDRPFNAYQQHALTKTLYATRPVWLPLLTDGKLAFDKDEHMLFALEHPKMENASTLIRAQIARQPGDAATQRAWLKALAGVGNAEDLLFVFERGSRDPAILDALANAAASRKPPPKTSVLETLQQLIDGKDDALRAKAVRLAGVWKVAPLTGRIQSIAEDDAASLPVRKAALAAVADLAGSAAAPELTKVLNDNKSPEVRRAALDALVAVSPDEAVKHVLPRLAAMTKPEEASPWLQSLIGRAQGYTAFRKALLKPDALSPATARLVLATLNQIGRNDKQLSPPLMKLAGINGALPEYTKEVIAGIVDRAKTIGNAADGRKIFEQTGCIACHTVNNVGGKIGPDLSVVGRALPMDMIVTEVIWPAINVKEGYEAATAILKDGTIVTGFKQSDTAEAIAIRDPATGAVTTIKRANARSVQVGGTVMPDGLTAAMSDKQLADLIRYLSELGADQETFMPLRDKRILVFTKTMGDRHEAVDDGVAALRALGNEHDFTIETSDDPGVFTLD